MIRSEVEPDPAPPGDESGTELASLHVLSPKTVKDLIEDGADPAPSASPEEFGALIRSEIAKWAKVVKAAGIQPE